MKHESIIAFALALVAFGLAALAFFEQRLVGFPDGFISEAERATMPLATVFIWFSLATGLWFLRLGWLAARTPISRRLWVAALVYLLVATLLFAAAALIHQQLDSGGGA
jgi:hypothetical protein